MRIVYELLKDSGLWSAVDLGEWSTAALPDDRKRTTLHLAPDEWAQINHGTRVSLSDTVTRLATKWRIGEGEAARHITDVIGALQHDRLSDLVDSHNNPDKFWTAGYSHGYQDGRRDGIDTALLKLKDAGLANAVTIVEACKK